VTFSAIDYLVLFGYMALIMGVGLWVSRKQKGAQTDSSDYFLAGKGLSWWAVGASLIASNISAEQFIGMSGSGFVIGMGIASYEFMAAATLILVAVFFLPVFLKKGIYTMPQFLEMRYNKTVKYIMAVFWLLVFVFINLSSILYLGGLTIKNVLLGGSDLLIGGLTVNPLVAGIVVLALFSVAYSLYGGLRAVALTDVIQVVFLLGGGLLTTYMALKALSPDQGFWGGFIALTEKVPEKFDLILDKNHPNYADLPGWSVLLGGMWIANLYYWGFNQYIIQRALAAKSITEARNGLLFAGFLKILLPLVVVVPGIVAFALQAPISKPDEAYPWLLNQFIPTGVKGLAFAALVAAVISSLASMMNSISTIFTLDLYKSLIRSDADEKTLVRTGRMAALMSILIAIPVAFSLQQLDQAFQFIQEFTGFISPGALAIFILGIFWKKANASGALAAAAGSFVFSIALKLAVPAMPFMNRMGVVFLLCVLVMILFGMMHTTKREDKSITLSAALFRTTASFRWGSAVLLLLLIFLYAIWW
jgi:SSS family solute:Na+ symporter